MSASFVAASAPPATTISEIAPAKPVNRLFIVILLGSLKMDGPRQGRRPAASNGSHGKNFSLKLNPTPFFDVEAARGDGGIAELSHVDPTPAVNAASSCTRAS